MESNTNFWIWLGPALGGIVITMAIAWLTSLRNYVSRKEVSDMIKRESPYLEDKKLIENRLDNLNDGQHEIRSKVEKIEDATTENTVMLKEIHAKVKGQSG